MFMDTVNVWKNLIKNADSKKGKTIVNGMRVTRKVTMKKDNMQLELHDCNDGCVFGWITFKREGDDYTVYFKDNNAGLEEFFDDALIKLQSIADDKKYFDDAQDASQAIKWMLDI